MKKYPTNPMKIKLWTWNDQYPVISMVFCLDYSCILYAVYRIRKISIDCREIISEETAVYSIDQMLSPNTLSSFLPRTSQLYRLF